MKSTNQVKGSRVATAILISWLLFIGVDFLFHASLFASLWKENVPAFKPLENLSLLIPVGYASFLLLTILMAYVFFGIYFNKPHLKQTFKFAVVFGLLYSLSNFLGLFSFLAVPIKHLLLFNVVYFIEIVVVTLSLHFIAFTTQLKRMIGFSILLFLILIIAGLLIQNIT